MQLQLSSTIQTPAGNVQVTVGHNTRGLWATFRPIDVADDGQPTQQGDPAPADEHGARRLMMNIKEIGYYAKRDDNPSLLRFGTTQSYQASWLLLPDSIATLAQLDLDALRDVIGAAVVMYRKLAPAGRVFADLAMVYKDCDPEVRKAITASLRKMG